MAKKKKDAGLVEIESEVLRDTLGACLVTTTGPLALPILACVLMEIDAEEEIVRITSTDLNHLVTAKIPAKMHGVSSMRLALSSSSLVELAREADSETIEWRLLDETKVDVKSGRCRLRLQGMDPDSFPPFPAVASKALFRVDTDDLAEMIDSVGFAAAKVAIYPVLTGIFVEAKEGELRLTATDRHRLATVSSNALKIKGEAEWVVPSQALTMIKRLWESTRVAVGFDNSWLSMWDKEKSRVLSTRVLGTDYPDYRKLLKTSKKAGTYLVDREDFAACLRRVAIVGSSVTGAHGRVIHLTFKKGAVQVEGASDDRGHGKEVLRVKSSDDGTRDFWMGAQMILDSLRVISSDKVRIRVNESERPILLENTEAAERHVLIPRRAP